MAGRIIPTCKLLLAGLLAVSAATAQARQARTDAGPPLNAYVQARIAASAGALEQASAQGRATARIERTAGHVRELQQEITALIL